MKKGSNQPPIIVKKIIAAPHGGHHGGAWKVAYADFVTAMMAFFLLMWLIGATTEKQRKALADYFAPTIVAQKQDSAGGDGFFGGDSIVSADRYPKQAGQTGTRSLTIPRDATGGPKEGGGIRFDRARFDNVKLRLEKGMKSNARLIRYGRNVRFLETTDGLRIDMVDDANFSMFARGTDRMTPDAVALFSAVGDAIKELPNKVIVRGHTDALPYSRPNAIGNWALSTMRAETARSALALKVEPARFARIEGVADKEPYDKADPFAPVNRRISVTLTWSGGR